MSLPNSYKVFLASKPEAQREYRTIEVYHPDFSNPLRGVSDFVPFTGFIEEGAPRDAGTEQVFFPISMSIIEPAENVDGINALSISLGATNDNLQRQVNMIRPENVFTPIECIYRKYYSGNTFFGVFISVAQLYLSISSISFDGYTKNTIIAEDYDFIKKSSGELYTLERFPGLRDA